ncbi:hypothetical protein [Pontibacter sp. G13]|uniref:hypothetical protein n=1 Tax=Pontibacter sp. G13 TaxID=3074898 RepID=UPI002888FA66|nr:hypothetical protein [Pontibacter sp. G13]WNJ19469.1 hypothetical protein RJD25_03160 [Pontibacter sp. G13]
MKNVIILFSVFGLLLCELQLSFAQSNPYEIVVNFSERSIDEIDEGAIQNEGYFTVKVKGINHNLYKVVINSSDTSYTKALDIPSFTNFDPSKLSVLYESIGSFSGVLTNGRLSETMPLPQYKAGGYGMAIEAEYINYSQFQNFAWADQVKEIRIKQDSQILKMDRKLTTAEEKLEDITRELFVFEYKHRQISKNPIDIDPEMFDTHKVFRRLEEIRTEVLVIRKSEINNLDTLSKEIEELKAKYPKDKELLEFHQLVLKDHKSLITRIDKILFSLKVEQVDKFLRRFIDLNNNASFGNTYTSFPIYFSGDRTELSIKVLPKQENSPLPGFEAKIALKPNRKIIFSVGPSFFYSLLQDEVFTAIGTPTNDSSYQYTLFDEGRTEGEFGIASLVRISGNKNGMKKSLHWHGAFGPGISFSNKIRPRILLGGGVNFGQKHKFVIEGGGIIGYVDKMREAVNPEGIYFSNEPNDFLIPRMRISSFLSFGYFFK